MKLLRESGAHLHAEEIELARLLRGRLEAGSGYVTPAESEVEGPSGVRATLSRPGSSGSGLSGVKVALSRPGSSSSAVSGLVEERRRRKAKCWELAGA